MLKNNTESTVDIGPFVVAGFTGSQVRVNNVYREKVCNMDFKTIEFFLTNFKYDDRKQLSSLIIKAKAPTHILSLLTRDKRAKSHLYNTITEITQSATSLPVSSQKSLNTLVMLKKKPGVWCHNYTKLPDAINEFINCNIDHEITVLGVIQGTIQESLARIFYSKKSCVYNGDMCYFKELDGDVMLITEKV